MIISKLRNGIGILKKQENITENLTTDEIVENTENAKAAEAAETEKKPARRPARKNTTVRRKKSDETVTEKTEKGSKERKN